MSENRLSGGEIAAIAFRVLGVIILLSGLAQALFMLPGSFGPGWSGWPLLSVLVTLAFVGAVALPLIFHAEWLVAKLFPKSEGTVGLAVTHRDLLAFGLALVGAWVLATNLPHLGRLLIEILWQAEGSRRSQLAPEAFIRHAGFELVGSVLSCAAGWLLFRYAAPIAAWWESRGRRPAKSPAADE